MKSPRTAAGAVLAICAIALGCTHSVHLVHVADYPRDGLSPGSATRIVAESEQGVILYLTTSTAYVDEAYDKLLSQCPNGQIVGVHTRFSTSHNFLSYTNRLRVEAWCMRAATVGLVSR